MDPRVATYTYIWTIVDIRHLRTASGGESLYLVTVFLSFSVFYRPQRSCGKVMFLHLTVSHSVHRGQGDLCQGDPSPLDKDLPRTGTPLDRHPLDRKPSLDRDPPSRQRPPHTVTIGRYASSLNAFLFVFLLLRKREILLS